jgi:hypothetical protein
MDKFWELDIYYSNTDNIHNTKIFDIITSINKLKKKISSNTIFNINDNLQLEIIDVKTINKEINKIKKDNINYLKTHVECIPEYFKYTHSVITDTTNNLNIVYLDNKQIEKDYTNTNSNTNSNTNCNTNIDEKNSIPILNIEEIYEEFRLKLNFDQIISEKIITKLKYNFSQIELLLEDIIKSNKQIILLDSENILKSFKIQHLLKNIIGTSEFNKYFDKWIYGDFNQINPIDSSMSVSEYSNSIKYIEPFNSIGLDLNEKNYLIDILKSNYLNNFFTIYFINTKYTSDNNFLNFILTDNSLCLPICYNKNDIREQDDHLIIFLFEYIKNFTNPIIISGDKFKFYNGNIPIKNLNLLYDCDYNKIQLIMSDQYSSDLIKINNSVYTTTYYFPNVYIGDFIKPKPNLNDNLDIIHVIKLVINKYVEYLIKVNNNEEFDLNDYVKNIIPFQNQTIKFITQINSKFKIIFNYLESSSKKDIFKLLIDNDNSSSSSSFAFSSDFIDNFKSIISKFKIVIKIYLIFKSFKQFYTHKEFTNKLSKLFSLIIWNYDKFDDNIHKIRKLSNKNSLFNIMFLEINSMYLYIKKIGLCKKI